MKYDDSLAASRIRIRQNRRTSLSPQYYAYGYADEDTPETRRDYRIGKLVRSVFESARARNRNARRRAR